MASCSRPTGSMSPILASTGAFARITLAALLRVGGKVSGCGNSLTQYERVFVNRDGWEPDDRFCRWRLRRQWPWKRRALPTAKDRLTKDIS
jgi:hypothetical protein